MGGNVLENQKDVDTFHFKLAIHKVLKEVFSAGASTVQVSHATNNESGEVFDRYSNCIFHNTPGEIF